MIPVKPEIAARAHIRSLEEYRRLYRLSLDDPEGFWRKQSEIISWFHPPSSILDVDMKEVDFSWYGGGRLNACFNCVDRHLGTQPDKTAIIWAGDEPGEYRTITYSELKHHVARVANVLLHNGISKGDRVVIYLPMIPELAYTMLACARIGAVHSVVFAGFSAESLRGRILDAGAKMVITANEGLRGGKKIPLKATVDRAIDGLSDVTRVLVARRTDADVPMRQGRDLWLDEETARQRSTCPVEWMHAESPLFTLYTSGSTGKPKGVLHTTGGYMVYAAMTHKLVFDYHPGDVFFCAADIGWITGHSYILYGPLANGATTVMFESIPLYPDPGRYWRIVDDLGVNIFYTAPTALRAIAREGNDWVKRYSRQSLRVLGSVGEPINPEIWQWYHDVVGDGRCAVVDTWWQTETGGILITPLPGATPCKPGSATLPFFGVEPVLVDEQGNEIEGNERLGQPLPAPLVARPGAHDLRRPLPLPRDVLFALPGALLHRRRLPARRGRLLLDHRPRRRRAQRLGAPARHRRGRERAGGPRRGGRGGGRRLPARHQGHRHLRLRDRDSGVRELRRRRAHRHAEGAGAAGDRPDRDARPHRRRARPAEDPLRQDHAPHPAQDRERRHERPRRHHDPGRSVGGREAAGGEPGLISD